MNENSPALQKKSVPDIPIDITGMCPNGDEAWTLLQYMTTEHGSVVKLEIWSRKKGKLVDSSAFIYSLMGEDGLVCSLRFRELAQRSGIDPKKLARIIFQNVPTN